MGKSRLRELPAPLDMLCRAWDSAHDLGVVLRDRSRQLLAGDAPVLARRSASLLAERSGFDEQEIWEWGLLERVSTGPFALSCGMVGPGREMLCAAERLI